MFVCFAAHPGEGLGGNACATSGKFRDPLFPRDGVRARM